MSLTANSTGKLLGTATITPGYASGVSGSELKGTATITYGGAPTSNTAVSLPGTSGNVMNLGPYFPSKANPSTSNIYVEAWIYLPTGATGMPFTVSDASSEDMGFLVNYSTSALQFRVWNTGGSGINSDGNGAALASATWYHIAGSFDRTNNRVYGFVNGVVGSTVGVFSGTARARSSSNMTIGAGNSGTFFPFNGYIRDFRMVNGGTVPTTSFTPAAAPFGLGTPTYVASMGTPVLSLYTQYFYPSWLSLPGTSGNFMNLGATHPAHFDTRTSNLFMEAWVYSLAANGSANQQIIAVTDNSSTTDWNLFIGTDNIVHFGYWAPSYTQVVTGAFSFTKWNHVALSWNPVTRAMYVFLNGVASGPTTASTTGVYSAARELHIGSETTGSVFNGYIQDVRVIQGGTVPTTSFTPGPAPFGLTSPSYAPGGSVVLSLATQYMQKATTLNVNGVSPSTPTLSYGTPLFSQLSTAAASSAVGTYSLRALNATTAKVAKVNVKYPTGTFSTYTTVYGIASASSEYPPGGDNPYAWKAFDGISTSPNYWASGANYTQGVARTTGTVTVAGGVSYYGDWLQIQLPVSFVPTGYALIAQQAIVNTPGTWYVFGSTDGSTWTLLDTRSGVASSTFTNFVYNNYTITGATAAYSYYRIVCNIVSVNTSFALAEFNILRTTDLWADRRGNLLTSPVTGQPIGTWLQGATGLVDTWYDQSVNGYHMANTLNNQPAINLTTTPYSVAFSGGTTTWLYNSSVPLNFGSGSFTLRYVVSNNTGGCVLFKAIGTAFTWVTGYEKYFWLGNGAGGLGTTVGNYPSQVGNGENYSISNTAISGKSSVVHKATSTTNVPIYINGIVTGLTMNNIVMQNDPGNYLILGRGGNTAAYIGNIFELQLFSTPLSDVDRFVLEYGADPVGGTITTAGGYRIHTFSSTTTATFTFTVFDTRPVQTLVVAGGGGGGVGTGAGGGAGGLLYSSSTTFSSGSYTVTVGGGGPGGGNVAPYSGTKGTNSSIVGGSVSIIAIGGGPGGRNPSDSVGGSGGGGSVANGGSGTAGQGNAGGNYTGGANFEAGGGGGAGSAGGNGVTGAPGAGGNGLSYSISGSPVTYAGGGGGGTNQSPTMGGAGGTGGGGAGGSPPVAGTNGLGGGGGGGNNAGTLYNGAAGGSGVVIIAYPWP